MPGGVVLDSIAGGAMVKEPVSKRVMHCSSGSSRFRILCCPRVASVLIAATFPLPTDPAR